VNYYLGSVNPNSKLKYTLNYFLQTYSRSMTLPVKKLIKDEDKFDFQIRKRKTPLKPSWTNCDHHETQIWIPDAQALTELNEELVTTEDVWISCPSVNYFSYFTTLNHIVICLWHKPAKMSNILSKIKMISNIKLLK